MKTQKRWLLPVLSCMGMMGIISTAQAAVTVYWEEDGTDVLVSWSGTLDVDDILASDPSRYDSNGADYVAPQGLYHSRSVFEFGYYSSTLGASSITLLNESSIPSMGLNVSFGFTGGVLLWNDVHISGGSVGAVSQLTFDPTRDVIRFSGQTLAGMNAGGFSNTLAWTAATTGDTIRYTTVIPEPSSASLLGLGTLALFARRKR